MILRWRKTTSASPSFDPTVQALRSAAIDAQRSRIPQMAAALSYRTVFGMLPILAVALWVLHSQVKEEELQRYVEKGLELLGLTSFSIDATTGPPVPPDIASPSVVSTAPPIADAQTLQTWVSDFVKQINKVSFGAIGTVGVGMLIYAALSMVVEIERAFNQIFRVPRGRSWARRIGNYWTLLTLGPLGLLGTYFLQQKFNDWVAHWSNGGLAFGSAAAVLTVVGYVTQLMISAGVLLLLYMVVPNTRVRFVSALCGALLAAAVFEFSKFGFAKYVEFSAGQSYTRLYGSLALVPLVLLWIYFTWMIVLFGMQLTYQLQYGRSKTRPQPIIEFGPSVVEPSSALTVMGAIGRAFTVGATMNAPDIARQTRLNDGIVRVILGALCERGLLHRFDSPDGEADQAAEPGYALARAADAIRVSELLDVGYLLANGGPVEADLSEGASAQEGELMRRLRAAQIAAAGDQTLADVVRSGSTPAKANVGGEAPAALSSALTRTPTNGTAPRPAIVPLGSEPTGTGGAHRPE